MIPRIDEPLFTRDARGEMRMARSWYTFFSNLLTERDATQLTQQIGGKQDQADVLDNIASLTNPGVLVRTNLGDVTTRTPTGGEGIDITNATGNLGNPTWSLAELADTGIGEGIKKITRDGFGRIEGMEDAASADLPYTDTLTLGVTDAQSALTKALGALPYFSDTAPDPDLQPIWADTSSGVLYAWWADSAVWVEFGTIGGSSGSDGMTPYYIAADESFVVPLYKQAPFHRSIVVDGSLIVDGTLYEV